MWSHKLRTVVKINNHQALYILAIIPIYHPIVFSPRFLHFSVTDCHFLRRQRRWQMMADDAGADGACDLPDY